MTTASDGYSNLTQRDTTGCAGGISGHVNTATTTHSIAGKDVRAFEWAHLCLLDNHAEAGENVAPHSNWSKGVELAGRMDVGIDLSNCQTDTPIKLPGGLVLGKRDPLVYAALALAGAALAVGLVT